MKSAAKLFGLLFFFTTTIAQAEPVMTLITVNTQNPAGYAAWAKENAEAISKANGAMAMGLCSPTTGAEQMGDHYLWSFFASQEAVWSSDPMNPTVQKAVASMDVERKIRSWDNWRIIRAAQTSEKGYYYNLYVQTENPAGYVGGMQWGVGRPKAFEHQAKRGVGAAKASHLPGTQGTGIGVGQPSLSQGELAELQ